jgi:hypothetical protein
MNEEISRLYFYCGNNDWCFEFRQSGSGGLGYGAAADGVSCGPNVFDFSSIKSAFLKHRVDQATQDLNPDAYYGAGVWSGQKCDSFYIPVAITKPFIETLTKFGRFTDIETVASVIKHRPVPGLHEGLMANNKEYAEYCTKHQLYPASVKQGVKKSVEAGAVESVSLPRASTVAVETPQEAPWPVLPFLLIGISLIVMWWAWRKFRKNHSA